MASDLSIPIGTYVIVDQLADVDLNKAALSSKVDRIFVVGNSEDKFVSQCLEYNTTTNFRKKEGFYSGPVTDLSDQCKYYLSSAAISVVVTKQPTEQHLSSGREIILLSCHGNDGLCGKKLTIGATGLSLAKTQNGITLYTGTVIENKGRENEQHHIVYGAHLNVIEKINGVMRMATDERIGQFYKIDKVENEILFDFESVSAVKFPDAEMAKGASLEHWYESGFEPKIGMQGELVFATTPSGSSQEFSTLKVEHNSKPFYVSIATSAVTKVATPEKKVSDTQKEDLIKQLKLLKQKPGELENLIEKVFKDESKATLVAATEIKSDSATGATPKAADSVATANKTSVPGAVVVGSVVAAISTSEKKEGNMSTTEKMKQMFTNEKPVFKKGGIKAAAKQTRKLFSEPIINFLNAKFGNGEGSKAKIAAFMNSEEGKALLSVMIGAGLALIPAGGKQKEFISAVSEELRAEGYGDIMVEVTNIFMEPIQNLLNLYATALGTPDEEEMPSLPVSAQPVVAVVNQEQVVEAGSKSR